MEQTKEWRDEEQLKDNVYASLELREKIAYVNAQNVQKEFGAGRFEDRYTHVVAGEYSHVQKQSDDERRLVKSLWENPYFAHIQLAVTEDDSIEHYMFSDSESLEEVVYITEDRSTCIVPFKQNRERPLLNKLRILPTAPSDADLDVEVYDARNGKRYHTIYKPQIIRNVDIYKRKLRSVTSLLGIFEPKAELPEAQESTEYATVVADDLLARRLEENRTDASLRNIISTLQKKQFEIIQSDIGFNFAVQGCAGSGKTQCMIHRLFFLRESLSESGWNKVVLITPTQLFRNYSSELMKRYRLTDVVNMSLPDFYCKLLEAYDSRFRNRQYRFELSEEYLPDEYLQQVYSSEMMAMIDNEIDHAIQKHVESGLYLLDEELDPKTVINIDMINNIVVHLTDRIAKFDETEKSLSELPEYQEHRKQMDDLEKQLKALQRKQGELLETKEKLDSSKKQFDALQEEITAAEHERATWKEKGERDIDILIEVLRKCEEELEKHSTFRHASDYTEALYRLCDVTESWGKSNQYNQEYTELLECIVDECKQKMLAFTKKMSSAAWTRDYEKRVKANEEAITGIADDITLNQLYQEDESKWLSSQNVEDAQKQRRSQRAALERSRYYLSRIESSVFEQEVWDALTPLKTKYGIKTLEIEELSDRHKKQTRILYKSDLLFYLKIYATLHTTKDLPDYSLICIDEGQDLHRADYDFLQKIYPHAQYNIFGDVVQSLHESCGISDWESETGVDTVYSLNSNYRNTPAIVKFCNDIFGEHMEYCGKVLPEQNPTVIHRASELTQIIRGIKPTVIIKDRQAFDDLIRRAGLSEQEAVYIDTKAEDVPAGKIACFTIFAAKGLEFTNVLVYAKDMNRNQRIVACTRAMERLYYCLPK